MNIDDFVEGRRPGFRLVELYEAKEGGSLHAKVFTAMTLKKHFTVCKLAGGGISNSRLCKDNKCSKTEDSITLLDENKVANKHVRCSLVIPQGSLTAYCTSCFAMKPQLQLNFWGESSLNIK